jgi:hypothetical protein
MVFKGSRYSATEIVELIGPDGRVARTLTLRAIAPEASALDHTVSDGERLDTLANRFYGEATRYWLILDANPDPLNPFELLEPIGRVEPDLHRDGLGVGQRRLRLAQRLAGRREPLVALTRGRLAQRDRAPALDRLGVELELHEQRRHDQRIDVDERSLGQPGLVAESVGHL